MRTVVVYIGRFGALGGLADAALGYLDAFRSQGIPVVAWDYNSGSIVGQLPRELSIGVSGTNCFLKGTNNDRFVVIFHDIPPEMKNVIIDGAVRLIAFTVNETVDYPSSWAASLMDAHEVWTASQYNVVNISREIPGFMVHRFPHPFTEGFASFARSKLSARGALRKSGELVRFVTICSSTERRQLKRFVEVFRSLVASGEKLEFTIKTRNGLKAQLVDALGITTQDTFLTLEAVTLDRPSMYEYLDRYDVFVNTEWGRGWDLPGFSSLALGKLYLAPFFGGNVDFMDNPASIGLPVDYYEYIDDSTVKNVKLYAGQKGGFNNLETIRDGILQAISKMADGVSTESAEELLEKFSAAAVGRQLKSRIEQYQDYDFYQSKAPQVRFRPRRGVVPPTVSAPSELVGVNVHSVPASSASRTTPIVPRQRKPGPVAKLVSRTLRPWAHLHSAARTVYRRLS